MEQQFQIEGMSCGGCVASVERALKAVGGVSQVQVDLASKQAHIEFDPAQTNAQQLQQVIEDAGYEVLA